MLIALEMKNLDWGAGVEFAVAIMLSAFYLEFGKKPQRYCCCEWIIYELISLLTNLGLQILIALRKQAIMTPDLILVKVASMSRESCD